MRIPKYTYIVSLRGGNEKSFDNHYEALEYVLSINTTDNVVFGSWLDIKKEGTV